MEHKEKDVPEAEQIHSRQLWHRHRSGRSKTELHVTDILTNWGKHYSISGTSGERASIVISQSTKVARTLVPVEQMKKDVTDPGGLPTN